MADHAAEWEQLATETDEHAEHLASRGEHAGAYRNKAETYRRAARAIRLEDETGAPHCTCCLKPIGPVRRTAAASQQGSLFVTPAPSPRIAPDPTPTPEGD